MLRKLHRWLVQRAYRTVARHDKHLGFEAFELRMDFVRDSVRLIDALYAANDITRTQRRQMKRDMINAGGIVPKQKGEFKHA